MSKKQKEKGNEAHALPSIPEKYTNLNKLEENENRLQQDKIIIEKLKNENSILFEKMKRSESEFLSHLKIYEKSNEEKTRLHLQSEEELNKMRNERNNIERQIREECMERINELGKEYTIKIDKLSLELENYKEKSIKSEEERRIFEIENERLKKECDKVNKALFNNIQSYEKKLEDNRENFEKEIAESKKREEIFLKTNEDLMETDIYSVYRQVKKKFEEKLTECLSFKGVNDRISDENKLFKLNLDNSENLIKECAKVQIQKQKIIKSLKEQLEEKKTLLDSIRLEHKTESHELNFKYSRIIEDKDNEIKNLKNILVMKVEENNNLRTLSQIILDQRSEIEQFFIESLEEVKIEIFKKKKEEERKGKIFPSLSKKYEEKINAINSSKKVDIKELLPEDKEKVLRLLFSKINENYKPKSYKNIEGNWVYILIKF